MERVERVVQGVAWRLGAEALLGRLTVALSIGVGVSAALVLAERLLSLSIGVPLAVAVPLGSACLVIALSALSVWPDSATAALRADARLGLEERLSSALVAGEGPMAALVRADAARQAAHIDVRRGFPVRLPRSIRALAALIVVLFIAMFVPGLDLLGWGEARRARERERAAVRETTGAARESLAALGQRARRRRLADSARVLARIDGELASLSRQGAGATEADACAADAKAALDAARKDNSARKATVGDQEQLERLKRESDILLSASRTIERWRRQLAERVRKPGPSAAQEGKSDSGVGVERPSFVRGHERAPAPREVKGLERELVEARPAAAAAMARQAVPWRYRAAVRRYFSPDVDEARPGQ